MWLKSNLLDPLNPVQLDQSLSYFKMLLQGALSCQCLGIHTSGGSPGALTEIGILSRSQSPFDPGGWASESAVEVAGVPFYSGPI